jgi:hypothetical protein
MVTNKRKSQTAMYAVWCEVSGGVTGPRAGWMKAVRTLLIAAAALAIGIVSAHADIELLVARCRRAVIC